MKIPAICTWIGAALRRLYVATPTDDPLGAIARDAVLRGQAAAAEAIHQTHVATKAIDELLEMIEAEKHGTH